MESKKELPVEQEYKRVIVPKKPTFDRNSITPTDININSRVPKDNSRSSLSGQTVNDMKNLVKNIKEMDNHVAEYVNGELLDVANTDDSSVTTDDISNAFIRAMSDLMYSTQDSIDLSARSLRSMKGEWQSKKGDGTGFLPRGDYDPTLVDHAKTVFSVIKKGNIGKLNGIMEEEEEKKKEEKKEEDQIDMKLFLDRVKAKLTPQQLKVLCIMVKKMFERSGVIIDDEVINNAVEEYINEGSKTRGKQRQQKQETKSTVELCSRCRLMGRISCASCLQKSQNIYSSKPIVQFGNFFGFSE